MSPLLAKGLAFIAPTLLSNLPVVSGLVGQLLRGEGPEYATKFLQFAESVASSPPAFDFVVEATKSQGIDLSQLVQDHLPLVESFLGVQPAEGVDPSQRIQTVCSALLARQSPHDLTSLIVCPSCGFTHATI